MSAGVNVANYQPGQQYEGMNKPLLLGVCIFLGYLERTGAFPQPNCRDGLEYTSGVCCSKCPAGKRQAAPCTRHGEEGKCEECDDGTFTEHGNVLDQCFKCTQCRPDQEVVRPCTHTRDGECQCKAGRFCAPDQACEVCKKCLTCKNDEELVRNCTSTSNSVCKKRQLEAPTASVNVKFTVPMVLAAVGLIIGVMAAFVLKCRRATDSPMNPHDRLKAPDSEECDDSGGNDRSSAGSRGPSCFNVGVPWPVYGEEEEEEEEEEFPKLVAVNGEESLRKCFEYFEDVDFHLHRRFFRHLDVADNVIKSKDHLPYDDKIHELLTIWVEKAGRAGTLNNLLTALLNLQQRRTAETIKDKAIRHGHYNVQA